MTVEVANPELPCAGFGEVGWAVDPGEVRVWRDELHLLHVAARGEEYTDVAPRHAFPLSARGDFVSFIGEKDEEKLLVRNASQLDPDSLRALDEAMGRTYYRAMITKIDNIAEVMGVSMWEVVTDRGYAKFEVVDRQRHIRVLPRGRFLITDADGNRFEIPCVYELDEHSQRLVETET